ncbi:MAG: acyl-CoA dehydrogenase family protein [Candidatus Binatia bacterium]|nr:acyl-CoA dehydrogenase family protein [Candidatus Binatia bacterium]
MDLTFSKEDEKFRRGVRTWLRKHLPRRHEEIDGGEDLNFEGPQQIAAAKKWQRTVQEAGYVAIDWPEDFGGKNASAVRHTILAQEMVAHRAPGLIGQLGLHMLGPTLIRCGTDSQRKRFLPKILTAEEIWCQGYSEPGSGSDLASLRTKAEIDGDFFVVNGQKIWTTTAHFADWMFCLVRTNPDAPKHKGISYLLIDMSTPGIEVRPLVQMTGQSGFNEVFFTDVRIPKENLVGELHGGWAVANTTLSHERNMLANPARTQQLMADLLRLAARRNDNGGKVSRDALLRQKLADLQIRVDMMKYHSWKQLSDEVHGRPPGAGASINKLVTTELNHEICSVALELLGDYGPLVGRSPHAEDRGLWPRDWMFTLGMIIGGGTSQIQKNIIAERVLGLPRGN